LLEVNQGDLGTGPIRLRPRDQAPQWSRHRRSHHRSPSSRTSSPSRRYSAPDGSWTGGCRTTSVSLRAAGGRVYGPRARGSGACAGHRELGIGQLTTCPFESVSETVLPGPGTIRLISAVSNPQFRNLPMV